jgi:signal peptidase I
VSYYDQKTQPTNTTQVEKKSSGFGVLIDIFQTVLLALVFYFLIDLAFARVRVENISMEPTLAEGEYLIVNKLAYRFGEMHTGDVVVFHYTVSEDYVKRLIGLPGDHVEIYDGKVFVNGIALDEPYIAAPPHYTGAWDVPAQSVFVLGDNRNQSSDSHRWGFLAADQIVGKALVVYWPLSEMKLLTDGLVVNASP